MRTCDNCGQTHVIEPEVCVAHALLMARYSDGVGALDEIKTTLAQLDSIALWDDLGRIVDKLVAGGYAREAK